MPAWHEQEAGWKQWQVGADRCNVRGQVLRFVLFVPALLYAVFDYYVFILLYLLAVIASSLFDDIL